jgi:hypothetical protein
MSINKFIKTAWTNMNIRAGKYKHLQNKDKNKCYKNIIVDCSYDDFKNWCLVNSNLILSLKRPSIDRINSSKNYSINNMQIIELKDNIKKSKVNNNYINGKHSKKIRGVSKRRYNKWYARIYFKTQYFYLGEFDTKLEALKVFRNKYFEFYNKYPFDLNGKNPK